MKETGSWSGSVSYMNLAQNNYQVEFRYSHILYTTEYNLRIEPGEFLDTANITARSYPSGAIRDRLGAKSITQSPFYKSYLINQRPNGFTYMTHIGLYNDDVYQGPLIMAKLSRPIKMTSKVPITIRLKFDMIL